MLYGRSGANFASSNSKARSRDLALGSGQGHHSLQHFTALSTPTNWDIFKLDHKFSRTGYFPQRMTTCTTFWFRELHESMDLSNFTLVHSTVVLPLMSRFRPYRSRLFGSHFKAGLVPARPISQETSHQRWTSSYGERIQGQGVPSTSSTNKWASGCNIVSCG